MRNPLLCETKVTPVRSGCRSRQSRRQYSVGKNSIVEYIRGLLSIRPAAQVKHVQTTEAGEVASETASAILEFTGLRARRAA